MSSSKILPKKLKIARTENGFTQKEVAKETGISQASIAHYETGHVEPSIDTIELLASFYGVTIDWLFGKNIAKNSKINNNSIIQINNGSGSMYVKLTKDQIKAIKES